MKRLYLFYFFLALCLSCQTEDLRTEIILRVKANKIGCSGHEGQTECYLVQQGDYINCNTLQYFYDQIEGLNMNPALFTNYW